MKGTNGTKRAIGISPHTGWAACVVVGGSLSKPEIVANEIIDILGDDERFCFHMAAEMKRTEAAKWIADLGKKARGNAKRVLEPLVKQANVCAIVAKDGESGALDAILNSHPHIHTAEGQFYRDVLREVCPVPVHLVAPKSIDITAVGKLAPAPWGKDQKMAAVAGWSVLRVRT